MKHHPPMHHPPRPHPSPGAAARMGCGARRMRRLPPYWSAVKRASSQISQRVGWPSFLRNCDDMPCADIAA
eukprot:924805-Rhodomonas_salina.1